jgi:hypothetical protein
MNQINTIKKIKHSKQPGIWIWALTLLLIAALIAATAWYFAKRRAMHPGKISINAVTP